MLEIKLILCPIDFSEFSVRAYRHALSLAEHYRSRLVVQHVVELWRYPYADYVAAEGDYKEFCRALQEGGREKLQEFVKAHPHPDIHPELAAHQGSAPDCILSFAQAQKADVIVMGTHGRRGFDRLVLGSVTDRVMRRASCPVLVVCQQPQELATGTQDRAHKHQLHRILFCADYSESSQRALNYAISAALEYDAELTMLHVLEETPTPAKAEEVMTAATKQLDKLIPPEGQRIPRINKVVRIGKPYRQIIQFAQETQTEIVIMGARGRGALDVAVFGSTTYRVIQLGCCPVLAVHI